MVGLLCMCSSLLAASRELGWCSEGLQVRVDLVSIAACAFGLGPLRRCEELVQCLPFATVQSHATAEVWDVADRRLAVIC